MPLDATNFITKGPVKHADMLQFFNLFTGVMTDQPVTFSNVLSVGGVQGSTTVPLKLYGAPGQTTNLLDLYPDRTSAQPGFGFSAVGRFGWGPGGAAPQDTFLSRIATQAGGADAPGLLITPELALQGNLRILGTGQIVFPSTASIGDGGNVTTGRNAVNISTDLAVQTAIYVGFDRAQYLSELRAGSMSINPTLVIHGADGAGVGLPFAGAHLQVRSDDMTDVAGATLPVFSAQTYASNWLQFNVVFGKVTAGVGWPGVSLQLRYDVDGNPSSIGGMISMMNGRVGIGNTIVNPAGDIFQVMGGATINGPLTAHGPAQVDTNLNADTITIDSGSNSIGAKLAFPQTATPKISLYDNGGGNFWGIGINSGEMYHCIPSSGSFALRQTNGSGPIIWSIDGSGRMTMTQDLVISAPRVLVLGTDPGGAIVSPGTNIGKSADTVYLANHAYVFFDLGVGHIVTAQQFIQSSDPNLKSNMTVFSDANCMARIRDTSVQVFSYQLPPPSPIPPGPPVPTPTPNNLGFDATQIHANSPEFSALDANGNAVGVNYPNIVSILWGALRQLDARCAAHGI